MTPQEILDIKAAVRKRDGYRCVHCGMTLAEHRALYRRNLEVHRLVPRTPYQLDSCITVCKPCHAKMPTARTTLTGEFRSLRVHADLHDMARVICASKRMPNGTRAKIMDLIDSILRPALTAMRAEAIKQVLAEYAKTHPPTE